MFPLPRPPFSFELIKYIALVVPAINYSEHCYKHHLNRVANNQTHDKASTMISFEAR